MHIELINSTLARPGGSVVSWHESDTRDNYLRLKGSAAQQWRSSDQWLSYHLNSQGYRAPEWAECDWGRSVIILGCSNIFGVGVAEHQTVAHLLSQRLDCPVINLGVPGASSQLIWQNVIRLKTQGIDPVHWVIAWPPANRFSEFTGNPLNMINHGTWSDTGSWAIEWVAHPHQGNSMLSYYADSCQLILASKLAQWRWAGDPNDAQLPDLEPFKGGDLARDQLHPGPRCHELMAEKIYNRLKETLVCK